MTTPFWIALFLQIAMGAFPGRKVTVELQPIAQDLGLIIRS